MHGTDLSLWKSRGVTVNRQRLLRCWKCFPSNETYAMPILMEKEALFIGNPPPSLSSLFIQGPGRQKRWFRQSLRDLDGFHKIMESKPGGDFFFFFLVCVCVCVCEW